MSVAVMSGSSPAPVHSEAEAIEAAEDDNPRISSLKVARFIPLALPDLAGGSERALAVRAAFRQLRFLGSLWEGGRITPSN